MNKILISALGSLMICGSAMAEVTVKVNPSVGQNEFDIEYRFINDLVKPRMDRPDPVIIHTKTVDGQFVLPTVKEGNIRYIIPIGEGLAVYATPQDNMIITINSDQPLNYSVSGSKLMEDISNIENQANQLSADLQKLVGSGNATEADVESIYKAYDKLIDDYISANQNSEALPYAIMQLEGQKFLDAYNSMSPAAKSSPIAVLLESHKKNVERNMEAEKRKAELASGKIDAPDFTFKDAEGKPVSLSDFKGKWVVIDFWGTWCPWCIKGFPALKEAYAELSPRLEVLGVACNDKYDAWLKGLKKYELPWVNVYNPENGGGKVLEDYAVEGFPTKVIVNPEGKIVNVTTGEDPNFFNILREMVK